MPIAAHDSMLFECSPEFKGIETVLCLIANALSEFECSPEFKGIETYRFRLYAKNYSVRMQP